MTDPTEYVVWNGTKEEIYLDTPKVHDCICLYDGMLSVQELRRELHREGFVVTILFACSPGQKSIGFPTGGVFSQSLQRLLIHDPDITIRDAVRLLNVSLHSQGFEQTCEAVCRRDVLDLPFMKASIPGAKHAICTFDMCRTPIPESMRKATKWHRLKPGEFAPSSNVSGKNANTTSP